MVGCLFYHWQRKRVVEARIILRVLESQGRGSLTLLSRILVYLVKMTGRQNVAFFATQKFVKDGLLHGKFQLLTNRSA